MKCVSIDCIVNRVTRYREMNARNEERELAKKFNGCVGKGSF